MLRLLPIAGFALVSLGLTGCAADWDTLTSHRFRDGLLEHPWATTKGLWVFEDPALVLRTDPPREGDERAAAMHRLQEPIRNGGTLEDQEVIVKILEQAATSDPSPVVRMEAIGALGRFEDPRSVGILLVAYQNAHGRKAFEAPPTLPAPVLPPAALSAGCAGTTGSKRLRDYDVSKQPNGFLPEWATAIRCRTAESLGRTGKAEACAIPGDDRRGAGVDVTPEGSDDRDVRLAAVRGLSLCRQPESVYALVRVLDQAITNVDPIRRDTAIIGRAHDGLVRLTGKKLPPDPQEWNQVVQAGVVIAPEPGWWENTIQQVASWVKP